MWMQELIKSWWIYSNVLIGLSHTQVGKNHYTKRKESRWIQKTEGDGKIKNQSKSKNRILGRTVPLAHYYYLYRYNANVDKVQCCMYGLYFQQAEESGQKRRLC